MTAESKDWNFVPNPDFIPYDEVRSVYADITKQCRENGIQFYYFVALKKHYDEIHTRLVGVLQTTAERMVYEADKIRLKQVIHGQNPELGFAFR